MCDESGAVETSRRGRSPVVVYYNGTFVNARNGAHARMASLLRYLVTSGHAVTLFSFENHPTEPWTAEAREAFRNAFPTVRLVLDRWTPTLRRLALAKNVLVSFFPWRSRAVLRWRRRGASPHYEELVAQNPQATWIVSYADGLTQLNGVSPAKVVVDTHDVKFINVAKAERASPTRIRSLLRARGELAVLDDAAAVVAVSPVEAGLFRAFLTTDVLYVPMFDRAERASPDRAAYGYRYEYDLVFVGSEMVQNARGLVGFVRSNAAWIGTLRIAVAGRVCDDPAVGLLAEDHPNVTLLGFVEDLSAVYLTSKAALAPVDGTGMKVKVVEALAHGCPVFASRHAVEGLPAGSHTCVFGLDRELIERLLADGERLEMARKDAVDFARRLTAAGDLDALGALLSST